MIDLTQIQIPSTYVDYDSSAATSDMLGSQPYKVLLMAKGTECDFKRIDTPAKASAFGPNIESMYYTFSKNSTIEVYGLTVALIPKPKTQEQIDAEKKAEEEKKRKTGEGAPPPAARNLLAIASEEPKAPTQAEIDEEKKKREIQAKFTEALNRIADLHFNIIGLGFDEAPFLQIVGNELKLRADATKKQDGLAISATDKSSIKILEDMGEVNATINNQYVCLVSASGADPLAITGAIVGQVATSAQEDPARPFQTLELTLDEGKGPKSLEIRTLREAALSKGISTLSVDASNTVRIERLVTTAQDRTFHNPNVVLILSFIRWDFQRYFDGKYKRYKLAGDDFRGSGPVMTPRLAKAECVVLFRQWEEAGLVQDIKAFMAGLTVRIHPKDSTILEITMTPKLMSQLCVIGVNVKFKL